MGAIEALARYGAASGDAAAAAGAGNEAPVARTLQDVEYGQSLDFAQGATGSDLNRCTVVALITPDLLACLKALERLDVQSSVSAGHLHTALSAYAKALVKGQDAAHRGRAALTRDGQG